MARRIGWGGTPARAGLGVAFVAGAFLVGPVAWADVIVGLVILPTATTIVLRLRGSDAPPLRWTGPFGHLANIAIGVVLAVLALQGALIFYGAAMILAAAYGYAGCELFAFANRINGRSDEIGCPVFWPIDAAERRATLQR
ncbi:MAG: hypothetical protein ACRDUY_10915 [Nitriliruptorales bacterium]